MRENITDICINNVNRNIMGNQRTFINYFLFNNNIDGNMVGSKEFLYNQGCKESII